MECSHTVSLHFHQLHDTYAAVLIAPSAKDSGIICNNLKRDNLIYEDLLMQGRSDPGWSKNADWFKVRVGLCSCPSVH